MAAVLDKPWAGETFAPPTPVTIAAIENQIVERLRERLQGEIEVAHFPDAPEAYRLTHRVGAALVIFAGAEYGAVREVDVVAQERTLTFEVHLLMRDLGWNYGGPQSGTTPGAYAIIEAVRGALLGFDIPGCDPMTGGSEKFRARDSGVWQYTAIYNVVTLAVQELDAIARAPFLRGDMQERGGLTLIAVAPADYQFDLNGAIQLAFRNVSSVIVSDPNTGDPYDEGVDYSVEYPRAIVRVIEGGALAPEITVRIAFSHSEISTAISGGGKAPTAPTN